MKRQTAKWSSQSPKLLVCPQCFGRMLEFHQGTHYQTGSCIRASRAIAEWREMKRFFHEPDSWAAMDDLLNKFGWLAAGSNALRYARLIEWVCADEDFLLALVATYQSVKPIDQQLIALRKLIRRRTKDVKNKRVRELRIHKREKQLNQGRTSCEEDYSF